MIIFCFDEVHKNEELFWAQKARTSWLQLGDKNTRYFQTVANVRRKRNEISKIKDNQGNWWWRGEGKERVFIEDFKSRFSAYVRPSQDSLANFIDIIVSCKSNEQNDNLNRPVLDAEVFEAVISIGALKAPGPDGIHASLYHHYWEVIGPLVVNLVNKFS